MSPTTPYDSASASGFARSVGATPGAFGLLRLEGLAAFALAVALYAHAAYSWALFALLFLSPDVTMLGYVAGPRLGAMAYNAGHTYLAPAALALAGHVLGGAWTLPLALIWSAHIGFDRALGYGLKLPSAFGDTHLGRVGRRPNREA